MKITIKKLISICLTLVLATLIANVSQVSLAAEKSSINVIMKGNPLIMEDEPVLKQNKTYIPIRHFAEAADFKVEWIAERKTAKLSNSETTIFIPIGIQEVTLNGRKIMLDEKSFMEKGRIFIPLRSVSEVLSQNVEWDQKNKTIIVGEFTSREYVEGSLKDHYLYENQEYGFNMKIPNELKDKLVIKEEENAIRFYDKYNYENNENIGMLFVVTKTTNPEILEIIPSSVLKYDKGAYYIVGFASDVQYLPGDKKSTDSYMEILKLSKGFLPSFALKTGTELNPGISLKGKIALVTDPNLERVKVNLQKPINLKKYEIAYVKNIYEDFAYVILLRPMEPQDVDSVGYVPLENLRFNFSSKEVEDNSIYGRIKEDNTSLYNKPNGNKLGTIDSQYTLIEKRQENWVLISQKGGAQSAWVQAKDIDCDFSKFAEDMKNTKYDFEAQVQ